MQLNDRIIEARRQRNIWLLKQLVLAVVTLYSIVLAFALFVALLKLYFDVRVTFLTWREFLLLVIIYLLVMGKLNRKRAW